MAKATDPKFVDATKKQTSPSREEVADIPRIILDERRQASLSLPSSLETSLYSSNLSAHEWGDSICDVPDKRQDCCQSAVGSLNQGINSHKPKRSSSDIGLPTRNTSHLKGFDGASNSENHLGVFCSPRTVRRSVDSGISTKEQAVRHGEWLHNLDYSNNCLKVLTSASRFGSALSLNSEYTARSIGLLSNDSDSDKELSLTESESPCSKPSQLRRFMSYTDDDISHELCTRPSQSLGDLNTMDNIATEYQLKSGIMNVQDSHCNVPTNYQSTIVSMSDSSCELRLQEAAAQNLDTLRNDMGAINLPSNMMSYKYDLHDATRDSRIRQWLQDMDSHH